MKQIIELMKIEAQTDEKYPDERIASTIYYTSLPRSIRSIENTSKEYYVGNKLDKAQEWLGILSEKSKVTPVLNFDRIKEYINQDFTSCDALFYWFDGKRCSYLLEYKYTSKKKLLSFLKVGNVDKDQIIEKIKYSKEIIVDYIEMAGELEHEDLIKKLHCIIVYDGKNDVVTSTNLVNTLPRKKRVSKGIDNHQNKASRQRLSVIATKEDEIEQFSQAVMKLGFASVTKEELPGNALPKVKKLCRDKVRFVTVMSSMDFAKLIENGYFDCWNWGEYKPLFD